MASISRVKPGDTVDCNIKGRQFSAKVVAHDGDTLRIDPPKGITWHRVTARQVTKVYRWNPRLTQITEA